MPEISIRPARPEDLPALAELDHNYSTEYVWQMEVQRDEELVSVRFREARLPRSVRVPYPRPAEGLADAWNLLDEMLVATLEEEVVGYAGLRENIAPLTTWVSDMAVAPRHRRQGIGSFLVLAAQDWGLQQNARYLILEMQTKNHPAIRMAQKLGFELCGYNDRYYENHDIGLFFSRSLR